MHYFLLLSIAAATALAVTPYEAYGLAADAVIETVSVTADGGVKKHIIARGDGAAAQKGQTVSAHYDGKLASDGKQFDSSRKRGQPFTFPLGGGRVIKGACFMPA